jgi:hypothetical protein
MSADAGPLATAVREIEAHAAAAGWDQPAQVFALVDTAELLRQEPQLAAVLGIEDAGEGELTPVEQETTAESLEELLPSIAWPDDVVGCAVVLEASTVPPGEDDADAQVPSDPEAAAAYVAEHPERQDARIVAGVLRTGAAWCAIRQRAHDDDTLVLTGEDLVPALVELLHATFVPDSETAPHE